MREPDSSPGSVKNKFLLDIKASHFLLLCKSCRFCGIPFPKAQNHRVHSPTGLEQVPSGVCGLLSTCLETCGLHCSTARLLAQGQHGALPRLPSYVPSFPPCNPQGLHMSKHRGSSSPGLATRLTGKATFPTPRHGCLFPYRVPQSSSDPEAPGYYNTETAKLYMS